MSSGRSGPNGPSQGFGQLPPPPGPPSRRRRFAIVIVASVVVVALVAAGAIFLSGRDDEEASGSSATPSTDDAVAAIVRPPIGLQAEAGTSRVELRWELGPGDVDPSGFVVFRNGDALETLEPSASRFVDDEVAPATTYRYEVQALDGEGGPASSASASAETGAPPVKMARLAGVFDVRLKKLNSYGVTGIPARGTAGWRFSPECDEGACDTRWRDIGRKQLAGDLHRAGERYSTSTTVRGVLQCSGTPTTSRITIDVRVTKADAVDGEWRATALRGTMTVDDSAQLGCRSSHIAYAVEGALAR